MGSDDLDVDTVAMSPPDLSLRPRGVLRCKPDSDFAARPVQAGAEDGDSLPLQIAVGNQLVSQLLQSLGLVHSDGRRYANTVAA